jgi:hypothetical protein
MTRQAPRFGTSSVALLRLIGRDVLWAFESVVGRLDEPESLFLGDVP